MNTTIQKIEAAPGQRIIAMSDIHGHFYYMMQLLRKLHYSGDDILVLVGDLVDKGPDSLQTLRYVMELARNHQVYVSLGNIDEHQSSLLCDKTEGSDQRFSDYVHYHQKYWGGGLLPDMLAALGIPACHITPENAAGYREQLRKHYAAELDFLQQLPTILETDHYIFVHGGIPTDDLDRLRGTDQYQWLKNDRFLEQGYRFSRCVVAGHWPVSLYRRQEENCNPIFDFERRIIGMDGGCGLKVSGQLNALVFPHRDADMREVEWDCYDGFPSVTALESQHGEPHSLHIQYFDNQVEIVSTKADMDLNLQAPVEQLTGCAPESTENIKIKEESNITLCLHKSSGRKLWIPSCFLYTAKDGTCRTNDYIDAKLEVKPGDKISAVHCGMLGCYGKLEGITGWYHGQFQKEPESLKLLPGRPGEEKSRRLREKAVYDLLDTLNIPYSHMDHQPAKNMEICQEIDLVLDAVICKNLFLRNHQADHFYLLMMPGEKKFKTKELSKQIGSARLSFGEAEYMERFLNLSPGAVSVMGLMNDAENQVQLLIDRDVLAGEYFGCHPCVNTSSIRLRLKDLLETILPAIHHEPIIVELNGE